MAAKPVYKVIFINQGQVYEVFACAIYQSEMYGFIEVEGFVFVERRKLVVDPSEEKLKNEFAGVKRSYIPKHAIVRIDEVEQEGAAKISEFKVRRSPSFPMAATRPSPITTLKAF